MVKTSVADATRAWAAGSYPVAAGVELLIHAGLLGENVPWLDTLSSSQPQMMAVDVDRLLDEADHWSDGQRRIARVAACLLGGPPVDLADTVTSLDRARLALILAALAHANGAGELHPWPAAAGG